MSTNSKSQHKETLTMNDTHTPTPWKESNGFLFDSEDRLIMLNPATRDKIRIAVNAHEDLVKIANSRRIELCGMLSKEKDKLKCEVIEEKLKETEQALSKTGVK